MDKPVCKLLGNSGNVYAIIGNVFKTLSRAGQKNKAEDFKSKAMKCESYDDVLSLVDEYVEVE